MKKKGFTLIELLIVIAIVGVLAVAFLPNLMGAPAKARDLQRISDLQKISEFLIAYNLEGNDLPLLNNFIREDLSTGDNEQALSKIISENIAAFNGIFPEDPLSNNCMHNVIAPAACPAVSKGSYFYRYADGTFVLMARMEVPEVNGNAPYQSGENTGFYTIDDIQEPSEDTVFYKILVTP